MSKYFGEFLIERKIISEEQLVEALVQQSLTLPSVLGVVRSLDLLSSSEILEQEKGYAIEFTHHLDDGLWNLEELS